MGGSDVLRRRASSGRFGIHGISMLVGRKGCQRHERKQRSELFMMMSAFNVREIPATTAANRKLPFPTPYAPGIDLRV